MSPCDASPARDYLLARTTFEELLPHALSCAACRALLSDSVWTFRAAAAQAERDERAAEPAGLQTTRRRETGGHHGDLPQEEPEARDGEAERHQRDARADPREHRALVRLVKSDRLEGRLRHATASLRHAPRVAR